MFRRKVGPWMGVIGDCFMACWAWAVVSVKVERAAVSMAWKASDTNQ